MHDLACVFAELKTIMAPYSAKLHVKTDREGDLYLDTRHVQRNRKPLFFGAVQTKKHYVSYHLMPVYVQPTLLEVLSPELRARMQGKSCFNFVEVDKVRFAELAKLTEAGFTHYQQQGFV